jgi:iron complex transport system ATP-binding protein
MMTVSIEGLSARYAQARRKPLVVVRDVILVLRAGEMVCLLGPNGAGKWTLMRTIAAMQTPIAGRVLIGGKDNFTKCLRPIS